MLYKKNTEKTLSDGLFKNPTSEYRGAPFWSWNCKLEEKELREQIGYLKEMGMGGFHMHTRVGMATEYLGDEFMHMISACVDEAKQKDMLAYLYDEDQWPSGFGGGFVTKDPKYAQRIAKFAPEGLDLPEFVDMDTAIAEGKAYLLNCYDIELNQNGELANYKQIDINDKAKGTKWIVYSVTPPKIGRFNGYTYVDTLNKEAIDKFIEVTYERYKEVVGDEFGNLIPSIFTDEPQFCRKSTLKFATSCDEEVNLPWTPKLPKLFKEHCGLDIFAQLPELLWDLPEGKVSRLRYLYHDFITELFTSSFADNIGKWCEENGIKLTGHLMCEDTLKGQTLCIGEAMRAYRGFQLPGIDTLCDNEDINRNCAKQCQSAVHQYDREGMMTELYGVTNWDFDFRHHKLQGDWEAATGATLRVHHLAHLSMAGEAKRDYPASINYQSPWYKEYGYIEDHFARVNTAMTRGKADVKVAVIHPVESYWLHWGPTENTSDIRQAMDDRFYNLCRWLTFGTIDFDYICEATLPSLYKGCSDGKLNIGAMGYTTVLVPAMETIRKSTLDALAEFKNNGGEVIFAGPCPIYVDAIESSLPKELFDKCTKVGFEKLEILDALSDVRDIEIRNDRGNKTDSLIYSMRKDENCKWLFIAQGRKTYGKRTGFENHNDMNTPYGENIIISIKGEFIPKLYDTLTGNITDIRHEYKNGHTLVYYTVYTETSILLNMTPGTDTGYTAQTTADEGKQIVLKGKHDYILEEPNVLLLDTAEFALDDGEFEPEEEILRLDTECRIRLGIEPKFLMPQPWVFDDKDSGHTVTLRFTINSEIDVENALLAMEDAEKHEITFNGEKITPQINGYFTDKSIKTFPIPTIKAGTNILTVKLRLSIRSNTEWCYILGNFGVKVEGTEKTIIPIADRIGYSPLKMQTMPFYGGNVTYINEVETPDCDLIIKAPFYRGGTVKVFVDGKDCGHICLAPCSVRVNDIKAGTHKIEFKLFGNRINSFGAVHNTIGTLAWYGPGMWRTKGNEYSYEYQLKDMGIMAAPVVTIIEK